MKKVSLSVSEGESIGLVGLNGSGKSSLIKIILGILKEDTGTVEVFERNPFKFRKKNALDIGVIFGQRSQLRWDLSASDSFSLIKAMYKVESSQFEKRLEELDHYLDFSQFVNQPVRTLSLGQRMRVEIAAALLHDPQLIILDEPTNGLDFISREKITKLIQSEIHQKKKTVVYISHYLEEIKELCNRIVVLNKGEIVCDQLSSVFYDENVNKKIRLTCSEPIEDSKFNFEEVSPLVYEVGVDNASKDFLVKNILSHDSVIKIEIIDTSLESYLENIGKNT